MKEMLDVLRNRDLRIVAAGRAASFAGDEVAVVALTLLAYDAGWGVAGVAAVLVAAALPLAAAAPLAGRLVDRTNSRRATVGAALWQAAAVAGAAAVLVAGDPASVAVRVAVLVLVAAASAGQAVAGPAWQALLPHVVAAPDVPRATAVLQTASTVAGTAGPAVGGLLVAGVGVPGTLLVDAVSFLALAAGGLAVRTVRRPRPGATSDGVWAGAALLARDRVLGVLVAGMAAVLVVLQVVVVVEVFLVRSVLGAGPVGYGLVGAAFPVGMVAGALLGGRVGTTSAQVRAVLVALAGLALGVVVAGAAPTLLLVAAGFAVVGAANGLLNVAFGALLVARTSDAVRGRVFSAVSGVLQTASVVGLAAGAVVGAADPRAVLLGAGVVALGVAGLVAVAVRGASAAAGVSSGAPVTTVTAAVTVES